MFSIVDFVNFVPELNPSGFQASNDFCRPIDSSGDGIIEISTEASLFGVRLRCISVAKRVHILSLIAKGISVTA